MLERCIDALRRCGLHRRTCGSQKIITYTKKNEDKASLRAAGWTRELREATASAAARASTAIAMLSSASGDDPGPCAQGRHGTPCARFLNPRCRCGLVIPSPAARVRSETIADWDRKGRAWGRQQSETEGSGAAASRNRPQRGGLREPLRWSRSAPRQRPRAFAASSGMPGRNGVQRS